MHITAEAREWILQRLAEAPEGATLNQLLPEPPDGVEDTERRILRWRLAWASTGSVPG
jgi:hypothetical protein